MPAFLLPLRTDADSTDGGRSLRHSAGRNGEGGGLGRPSCQLNAINKVAILPRVRSPTSTRKDDSHEVVPRCNLQSPNGIEALWVGAAILAPLVRIRVLADLCRIAMDS